MVDLLSGVGLLLLDMSVGHRGRGGLVLMMDGGEAIYIMLSVCYNLIV